MNEQLYSLLKKLVIKNQIQLHQDELKFQLMSHPSYPSLHSVTGVLDHFSIPNLAIKLPTTREVLDQLPDCVIVVIDNDQGEQMVLLEKKKTGFLLTFNQTKKKRISTASFLEQWTGVVVAIEKDDAIEEIKKDPSSIFLRTAVMVLFVGLLVLFAMTFPTVFPIAHFLLSGIGLLLSVFIIRHELGLSSPMANSICNFSEKTDCEAILNSEGAKILGRFKLSDISIVVFLGYTLSWLIMLSSGINNFTYFMVLSVMAVPVISYSIFQQAVVVKKWCPLCLGICGVLFFQFAFLFTSNTWNQAVFFDPSAILILGIGLLTSIGIWSFLKPLFTKKNQLAALEITHSKFKRNFTMFHAMYDKGESLKSDVSVPNELVFGNELAPIELIVVTSPYCGYCKKAHRDLHELLKVGKDKIRLKIRFNVNVSDENSMLYPVVSEILHTYHSEGPIACLELLDTLYEEGANVAEWTKQQNIHFNPSYDSIMAQQSDWCQENQINFTPALYLNGKEFPKEYDRTDLQYFLEDFIALQEPEKQTLIATLVAS